MLRRFEEGGTYVRLAFWMDSTIDFLVELGLRRKRRRRMIRHENSGRGLSKAASSLPWKADYRTELNIVNSYFAMFNYESAQFKSGRSDFHRSSLSFFWNNPSPFQKSNSRNCGCLR